VNRKLLLVSTMSVVLASCSSDSLDDDNDNAGMAPESGSTAGNTDTGMGGSDAGAGGADSGMDTTGMSQMPGGEENSNPPDPPGEMPMQPTGPSTFDAELIGPVGGMDGGGYIQFNDSPFLAVDFVTTLGYFNFEDFEDGQLDKPGASPDVGGFTSVEFGPTAHDSVDEDDGSIDGLGADGDSWFVDAGEGAAVTWTFDAGALGQLPTHVGVVWTDGNGTVSFEAFDPMGASFGVVTGDHDDSSFNGETAEDRFYGVISTTGISAIRLSQSNTSVGLEMDHLQWGFVPQPVMPAP